MVLAQQAAMKAAKRAMQARGIKVSYIARCDMVAAARDYLTPELIAATAVRVLTTPALATLVEPRKPRASLTSLAQTARAIDADCAGRPSGVRTPVD